MSDDIIEKALLSSIFNEERRELEKGKVLPTGTIRTRGKFKYIKTPQGWKFYSEGGKHASHANEGGKEGGSKAPDNVGVEQKIDPIALSIRTYSRSSAYKTVNQLFSGQLKEGDVPELDDDEKRKSITIEQINEIIAKNRKKELDQLSQIARTSSKKAFYDAIDAKYGIGGYNLHTPEFEDDSKRQNLSGDQISKIVGNAVTQHEDLLRDLNHANQTLSIPLFHEYVNKVFGLDLQSIPEFNNLRQRRRLSGGEIKSIVEKAQDGIKKETTETEGDVSSASEKHKQAMDEGATEAEADQIARGKRNEGDHSGKKSEASSFKVGDVVKVNDDVHLVSFKGMKGKSLKVKDIQQIRFASGIKPFLVVEDENGEDVEINAEYVSSEKGEKDSSKSSINPAKQSKKALYEAVNAKYGTNFKVGDIDEFEDSEMRKELSQEDVKDIVDAEKEDRK